MTGIAQVGLEVFYALDTVHTIRAEFLELDFLFGTAS